MKRKPLMLSLLVTILGFGLVTGNRVLAQQSGSMASSAIANSSSTTSATVTALTQQVAQLEVERALLDVKFTPDSPIVQNVERNLRNLRQRLAQIQPNGNSAVSKAIKEAIKAKIAELEIERARLATRFIPESPLLLAIDSQLRSLNKRLARP
jgi:uncharacterized protein involved in exopolysaccharide biosynthesis